MKRKEWIAGLSALLLTTSLYAMAPAPKPSESKVEPSTEVSVKEENALTANNSSTEKKALDEINSSELSGITLTDFHWQLRDVQGDDPKAVTLREQLIQAGQPNITLNFHSDRLVITHTCNQQMGSYSVDPQSHQVMFGPFAQTMRACVDPLMAMRDDAMINLFKTPQKLSFTGTQDSPRLAWVDSAANQFIFEGSLTPEAFFGAEGEVIFLEVSPALKACESANALELQCLSVRDVKYDEAFIQRTMGETWYDIPLPNIQGFNPEEGMAQIIRVQRFMPKDTDSLASFNGSVGSLPFYVVELVVEMRQAGLE